jgi:DNA-binding NtrC family response regulator
MQVKLLRLIESGTFRRVGGIETLRADFRLVAATHKPLQQMMADGRFRQDLYYRISAFPIPLPALRARPDDIPLLVNSILQRSGKTKLTVDPAAMARLQAHAWPGNIRELRNVLERARLFADQGVICVEHLPHDLGMTPATPLPLAAPFAQFAPQERGLSQDEMLKQTALRFTGTRRELAMQLGMSERTLYRRLKALGLA